VNTFGVVPASRGELSYFEIEVDGKPLAHHFAGRLRAHPSQISILGGTAEYRAEVVAHYLVEKPSELESGRVPVLVCEMCGDVGCGAFAVHVNLEGGFVRWTDWAYENGYEPARELTWPKQPGDLVFDRDIYESEIRKAL
jgi:hypothetical protein